MKEFFKWLRSFERPLCFPDGEGDDNGGEGGGGSGDDGSGDDDDKGGHDFKEGQEVEREGVKYKIDAEGNYCVGNVPVLDKKGVSFRNRVAEVKRKANETESQYQKRIIKLQEEKGGSAGRGNANPEDDGSHDDSEVEPTTGLTYGNIRALDKRYGGAIGRTDTENKGLLADVMIDGQKNVLKTDPQYKKFFSNKEYIRQLDANLKGLTLQAKLTPGIVKSAVHLIIGQNIGEFTRQAAAETETKINQNRSIVGIITLGPEAGEHQGKKVVMNEDIAALMKQGGLTQEAASEVWVEKEARRKAKEAKEGGN